MIQSARPGHRAVEVDRARRREEDLPAAAGGPLEAIARVVKRLRASPWIVVFLVCLVIVIVAYVDYAHGGLTLRYADGRSKLNMARRVWVNLDPGFGQIGGIWLPLPTLLMALTSWWDPMYYSGLSGSVWSMLAFAGTGTFLFLIGRRLVGHWAGGMVAAIIVIANGSALYLATTPMVEPLLLCGISGAVYMLMRVEEQPRDPGRLVQFAPLALAVTLIRYEGWFLLGVMTLMLAFIYLRSKQDWPETQARLIAFLVMAAQGVVLWLFWETVIFHDPIFFSNSKYSAHSIDVLQFGITGNWHDLPRSIGTYWLAMKANIAMPVLLLAGVGAVLYVGREWLSWEHRIPRLKWRQGRISPFALAAIPLFFIFSLYSGQAAIDIPADGSPSYNVRYGVIALPLVATFAAYAVTALWPRRIRWWPAMAAAGIAVIAIPGLVRANAPILNDRGALPSEQRLNQIAWLRQNYDGGRFLIEVFKNNDVTFSSRIPQSRFITEGNPAEFRASLLDPQDFVRWVYAAHEDDDQVSNAIIANIDFDQFYNRVYSDNGADIYRVKPQFDALQIPDRLLKVAAGKVARPDSAPALFRLRDGVPAGLEAPSGTSGASHLRPVTRPSSGQGSAAAGVQTGATQ